MGKQKKGRRRSAMTEEEFDDSASYASTGTSFSMGAAEGTTVLDDSPFEQCIDALYEKRATTREKALEGLVALLEGNFCYEEAAQRQETLAGMLLGCIRRGGAVEAALAARALGLLFVTLGADEATERLLGEAAPVLARAGKAGKAPSVCAAALEALGVATFVAAEDPGATDAAMAQLSGLWGTGAARVRGAALRGWSLLLTTVSVGRLEGDAVEAALGRLAGRLHDEDVEVRGAAGEAIALLYHTCGLAGEEDERGDGDAAVPARAPTSTPTEGLPGIPESPACGDRDATASELGATGNSELGATRSDLGATASSSSSGGADGGGGGLEEVLARMKDLATNRGDRLRRSRRERSSLRSTFRDLCNMVEDGSAPAQRVRLRHGDTLNVEGLAACCQLDALRRFLATGFQVHLQENPLLHQVFNYEPRVERAERLSALEKRMYRSPASAASKSRTQARNGARAASAAYKGAMLAGDW